MVSRAVGDRKGRKKGKKKRNIAEFKWSLLLPLL